ncbi:YdeI/OmpD-associated family protein [Hyphobacterium sp.]|uniref:YdeI/OmpD-associated family protein n=1 Tax=Hyphobacterium sp. TaxID=2004662 RepID=UPI003BA85231
MITEIKEYFSKGCGRCDRFATPDCSTRKWIAGLTKLRQLCLDAGLTETVKWGHPCYMFSGRNIAIIGAFRTDFRLSFFHAALMKDPEGVLEKQGPNTEYPDMLRFGHDESVAALEPVISAYLTEAKSYAEAKIKPPKSSRTVDLPDELIDALDADPELAEAFHRLTPGRQKSYAINLSGAKKPATRITRIAKFRNKILAGKGAMER